MPKLNDKQQEQANSAEGFKPLPEDRYTLELVKVTEKKGKDDPYWACEFKVVDQEFSGRRLWTNVSMAENAAWKVREFFDALGYTLDSSTDEMIGDQCYGYVGTEIQQEGKGKGQERNTIEKLTAIDA